MTTDVTAPPKVVHVLLYGLPLCGFSRDLPAQWPDGHVWTHLGSDDPVSCRACAAQVRELGP